MRYDIKINRYFLKYQGKIITNFTTDNYSSYQIKDTLGNKLNPLVYNNPHVHCDIEYHYISTTLVLGKPYASITT